MYTYIYIQEHRYSTHLGEDANAGGECADVSEELAEESVVLTRTHTRTNPIHIQYIYIYII